MFVRWLERPYDGLRGGTEETTSGRILLAPLRDRLGMPILVINDSPIKQFAENRHAVGQSTVESFQRLTNMATNGRRVVVLGYGGVGKGLAINFRNNHAQVAVLERDPVLRMEALWDGFAVPEREAALATADIVLTATAACECDRAGGPCPPAGRRRSSSTSATCRWRSTCRASPPRRSSLRRSRPTMGSPRSGCATDARSTC